MNIFATNPCPTISAYEHTTRHNVKMILELAQMLSTAHRLSGNNDERLYKVTHQNHPCSKWVRESLQNYQWAYKHFKGLCELYALSSGKVHLTDKKLSEILSHAPTLPDKGLTTFAMAMPDEHLCTDAHKSYRSYMNKKLEEWVDRDKPLKVEWAIETPYWISEELVNKLEKAL